MGTTTEETRKVQLTGGGTFIISLPREWIKKNNIGKGSRLVLKQLPDGSLLIMPAERGVEARELVARIKFAPELSLRALFREIVSYYVLGFDTIIIEVTAKEAADLVSDEIREFINDRMIDLEIVEDTKNKLVLKCFSDHRTLSAYDIIRRMHRTTDYMIDDIVTALKRWGDRECRIRYLQRVVKLDNEVDRFYLYLVRQLNAALAGRIRLTEIGIDTYVEVSLIGMVGKFIERVGDHAENIANSLLNNNYHLNDYLTSELVRVITNSRKLYNESMKSLYKRDCKRAHEIADKAHLALAKESELFSDYLTKISDPKTVMSMNRIIESSKRIAEYGIDIDEITINLCILSER